MLIKVAHRCPHQTIVSPPEAVHADGAAAFFSKLGLGDRQLAAPLGVGPGKSLSAEAELRPPQCRPQE